MPPSILEDMLLEVDLKDIEGYLILKSADQAWSMLDDNGKHTMVFRAKKLREMETGDLGFPRDADEQRELLRLAKFAALRADSAKDNFQVEDTHEPEPED